jgi:hypothetical protein
VKYLRIQTKACAAADCHVPEDRRMLSGAFGQLVYGDQAGERLGLHSLFMETRYIPFDRIGFTEILSGEHVFPDADAKFKPSREQIVGQFARAVERPQTRLIAHLPTGHDLEMEGLSMRDIESFLHSDDPYMDAAVPENFFEAPKETTKPRLFFSRLVK